MSIQTETEKLLAYGNRIVGCNASNLRELLEEVKPKEGTPELTYTIYQADTDSAYASVTGIDESWAGGKLVIAETYQGVRVSQMDTTFQDALKNNTKITSIYLPDNLIRLFVGLFHGCRNLEHISLGDKKFSDNMYLNPFTSTTSGASRLTTKYENDENNINDNIIYMTSRNGKIVFAVQERNIEPTKEYRIKDGTTHIGNQLFRHTANVTSSRKVIVPKTVKYISSNAFNSIWTDLTSSTTNVLTVSEVRFEHGPEDQLTLPKPTSISGVFKSKNAANITIYHRNNPAVLNYDYATDNVTPTFIEITD